MNRKAVVMTPSTFTVGVTLSTTDTGYQPANTSASSTLKLSPSLVSSSLQRASSFVFTLRLSPSLTATGVETGTSVLSATRLSSSSRATGFPSTNVSASTEVTTIAISLSMIHSCETVLPGVVSGYTPGNTSSTGKPLPLLAKILIPVAGVLLIVVVVLAWYCCVRRKESGDIDDLIIESTVMVRLDVSDDPGVYS